MEFKGIKLGIIFIRKCMYTWCQTSVKLKSLQMPLGAIQVLRHHVFDFFRPTHLFDDLQ